ncbi:MAG: hypothetical protein WBO34_05390 [Gammaproteobacteria bacterium]
MTVLVAPAAVASEGSRWPIGLLAMMLSFIAIAENSGSITLSPGYDDRLTDEIYNSARGWRKPPAYHDEWRPEKPQHESRIEFGYDSTYEALRSRDGAQSMDTARGLRDPQPATQFRIGF